jgi:hypothetical protein
MELEGRKIAGGIHGGLIMQRNKVHHVYTVGSVARRLGVEESLIHDLAVGLEPEDGVIWVYGLDDDDGTMAFTTTASTRFASSSKNTAARHPQKPDTPPRSVSLRGRPPCRDE